MANPIIVLRDYIKHSIAELKKVTWPNRDVTVRFSAIVIVISAVFAGFFAALDYGLQGVVDAVFLPDTNVPQPVDLNTQPTLLDTEGNPIDVNVEGGDTQTIQIGDVETVPVDDTDAAEGAVEANGELVLPSLE